MRCPIQNSDNAGILLDYCARKLNPETAGVLERHMENCPECRTFARAQQQVWSALDAWETEEISSRFNARLYSRVEEQSGRPWVVRALGDAFAWKPAVPFAAACAAAALALLLNIQATNPALPVAERPRIEALEPEQAEQAIEDLEMLRLFSTPAATQTL